MELTSSAFDSQATIPREYTGEGSDSSPPLAWRDVPTGAASLALIVDDPDAPSARHPGPEPWVHWVLFNMGPGVSALPSSIPRVAQLAQPISAQQGTNSWTSDNYGYRGPMPPRGSGPHRYYFRLYALDVRLNFPTEGVSKAALLTAMEGHVLASAELIGIYECG